MKAKEFKKLIKPLVEETIREVLLSEGVLSAVVSEVARGMNAQPLVENTKPKAAIDTKIAEKQKAQSQKERTKRLKALSESIGFKGVDIFEGTQPVAPEGNTHSPLSGQAPGDPGVDITAIQQLSNGKWKALLEGKK